VVADVLDVPVVQATSGGTCALAPTWSPQGSSRRRPLSWSRWRGGAGAGTRSGPCCSASTGRRGRPPSSWSCSGSSRRRPSAASHRTLGQQLDLFSIQVRRRPTPGLPLGGVLSCAPAVVVVRRRPPPAALRGYCTPTLPLLCASRGSLVGSKRHPWKLTSGELSVAVCWLQEDAGGVWCSGTPRVRACAC